MAGLMRNRVDGFLAVPYVCVSDDIVAGRSIPCVSAGAAVSCAQRLVHHYGTVGALALRSDRHNDSLHVIRAFGDVPQGREIELAGGRSVALGDERSRQR